MTSTATPVLIPLLNPNEVDARLVSLAVCEGQFIHTGDLIGTLETTKSAAEILAETDGFVVGLRFSPGQMLRAGDTLCYIAASQDWIPETQETAGSVGSVSQAVAVTPSGLRITRPALDLAAELGLDLSALPVGELVTRNTIQELASVRGTALRSSANIDPMAIIVYGGGGHGKSVIELLRSLGTFQIRGIVDDGMEPGQTILDLPILGDARVLGDLGREGIQQAVNAVGGIGDLHSRLLVFQRLSDAGFACPPVAHPSALIESSAQISEGVQVFPQAYVGSDSLLGFGVIVNTGAIVSHDCQVGEYANLSPGAILAGGVTVGSQVLIGMGATINLGVEIGKGSRIGNGATIKADLPTNTIVRAGSVWPA